MSSKKLVLVSEDTGLTPAQLTEAHELHAKFPAIVLAHKKVKEQEQNLRGKWLSLCEKLREPGNGVVLDAKQMTLILRGLGENKSRASEIVRVVSVDDDVWAKYKANVIGFRAVLAIARGKATEVEVVDSDGTDDEAAGGDSSKKDKPLVRVFSERVRTSLHETFDGASGDFVPTGKGYYAFSSVIIRQGIKRRFTVKVEVEDLQ